MEKLVSRASLLIKSMKEEGKVKTLTFHQSASIDHKLATGLKKIKTEFETKEKNSRAYVAQVELTCFNR
ncbi:MAG: hypothetical protein V3U92_05190 [Cellulophaga sp.]